MKKIIFFIYTIFANECVHAQVGVTIQSGAILVNQNSCIHYSGNVANYGTLTSTGQDQFGSAFDQTISGTVSGSNYFGTIQRMQGSGTRLIFATNVDANTVDLGTNQGTIDVGSFGTTLFVKSFSDSAIANYSSDRYIDVGDSLGFLKRATNDTIAGHRYVFPIGNSVAGYMRMDLNLFSLGAYGARAVSMGLKNGSPGSVSFSKDYATGFSGMIGSQCVIGTSSARVQFNCLKNNYWRILGPTDYEYSVNAYGAGSCFKPSRVIRSPMNSAAWTENIEQVIDSITDDLCEYSDWSNAPSASIPGGMYRGFDVDLAIADQKTPTLSVIDGTFSASVKIYPNPSNGEAWIQIFSPTQQLVEISISDMSGRIVFSKFVDIYATEIKIPIVPILAAGIYQVQIKMDEQFILRLVVE